MGKPSKTFKTEQIQRTNLCAVAAIRTELFLVRNGENCTVRASQNGRGEADSPTWTCYTGHTKGQTEKAAEALSSPAAPETCLCTQ